MSMTESECIESLNGIYPEWCSEKEEYEMAQVAIHALEEVQQFHAIGTVSDFRELKEKATAKKPRFYAHNYHCTECGNLVGNNEFEWQRFEYCDKCGQKLDWSEGKE